MLRIAIAFNKYFCYNVFNSRPNNHHILSESFGSKTIYYSYHKKLYCINLIEIQNINLFGSVYLSLSIKISTYDTVWEKIYENKYKLFSTYFHKLINLYVTSTSKMELYIFFLPLAIFREPPVSLTINILVSAPIESFRFTISKDLFKLISQMKLDLSACHAK